MNSLRSLRGVAARAYGFALSTRCRWKLPAPLATQTHEPKVKVVPSSSAALMKLNIAIEFAWRSLMTTPTWCASCWCFTAKPTEGYPRGGRL
jgi:hypothetical protein